MASQPQTAIRHMDPGEPSPLPVSRSSDSDKPDVEVSDLWRILRHRRRWVVGTASVLTAATLLYGLLTPSLYTATAQILVDPRDRKVVSNDVNPSTVSPDGGVTQVESQVSVVQSTGVLLRAIAATDLTNDPEFNGVDLLSKVMDRAATLFGLDRPAAEKGREARTITGLRRSLTVKRADKVLVIDLAVTSRNAEKSARLTNAIANAYLADQASSRAGAADSASDALTARLAQQRQRVRDAEDAVQRYRTENNIVVATGQLVSERQLSDVSTQLSAMQDRTATLKAKVDQIRKQRQDGVSPGATAEAVDSTVIAKLREQEATLAQREADLAFQLGPRHPMLAAVHMQTSRIRQLIGAELDRLAKAVQSDYDRALANERSLAAKLEGLKNQTLVNDQTSVRLLELQRERDAVRSVYGDYLVRVQETREQANVDSTNARVISQAFVPQQRSWPPLGLLLAGALFGGLGLGAALALVAEYVWPTILSCAQIQSLTGAPVIGILPPGRSAARRYRFPRRRRPGGESDGGLTPRTQDAVMLALRRLFVSDEVSRDGAAVRSVILTSSAADARERDRVVQFLAVTASLQGDRVLFIDADVSHNQESRDRGLLDVLRGECVLDDVVRFDDNGGPAQMGKGRQRPSIRSGSESALAVRLLRDARRHFDLVVVDGGEMAENLKVAPLLTAVQGVLLVSRLGATPQSDVVATTQMLHIAGRDCTAVMLVDATGTA